MCATRLHDETRHCTLLVASPAKKPPTIQAQMWSSAAHNESVLNNVRGRVSDSTRHKRKKQITKNGRIERNFRAVSSQSSASHNKVHTRARIASEMVARISASASETVNEHQMQHQYVYLALGTIISSNPMKTCRLINVFVLKLDLFSNFPT